MAVICCFTSTGNSLDAARKIAGEIGVNGLMQFWGQAASVLSC